MFYILFFLPSFTVNKVMYKETSFMRLLYWTLLIHLFLQQTAAFMKTDYSWQSEESAATSFRQLPQLWLLQSRGSERRVSSVAGSVQWWPRRQTHSASPHQRTSSRRPGYVTPSTVSSLPVISRSIAVGKFRARILLYPTSFIEIRYSYTIRYDYEVFITCN